MMAIALFGGKGRDGDQKTLNQYVSKDKGNSTVEREYLSLVTSVAPQCLLYCGIQRMYTQVQHALILLATKHLLNYDTSISSLEAFKKL